MPTMTIFPIMINFSSILVAFSASSGFTFWVAMEVNFFSLLLWLFFMERTSNYSLILGYFLIQTFMSLVILVMLMSELAPLLNHILFFTKLGAAPFHFWMLPVLLNVSWGSFLLLSTLPKLLPMYFLALHPNPEMNLVLSLAAVLFGVLGAVTSMKLKILLFFSSIFSNAWMFMTLANWPTLIVFITLYFMALAGVCWGGDMYSWSSFFSLSTAPFMLKVAILVNLLTFSGFPPSTLFLMKIMITSSTNIFLASVTLVGSGWIFLIYLNIFSSSFTGASSASLNSPQTFSMYLLLWPQVAPFSVLLF